MKNSSNSNPIALIVLFAAVVCVHTFAGTPRPGRPVKIIFDTDIGNDVDDVLALSMLHSLQTRADCGLIGVTITKPDDLACPFVDVMNPFYGRPNIPRGCIRSPLK